MTRKGPNRLKLEQYLDGAHPAHIDELTSGLRGYQENLSKASSKLLEAVKLIQDNLQGKSADAAKPHFVSTSDSMDERADAMDPVSHMLAAASATFRAAKLHATDMQDIPDDPAPVDPLIRYTPDGEKQAAANQAAANQNAAAYEAQEAAAAKMIQQLDGDNQAAVEELKKVHGIPDPPPPPPQPGTPQGPGVGTGVFDGPRGDGGGGGNGNNGKNKGGVVTVVDGYEEMMGRPPRGPVEGFERFPGFDDTGTGTGTTPDSGPVGGIGPVGGVDPAGNPFAGASGSGSATGSATSSGGGLSGPATAGLIGGAGVGLGGVGGLIGKSLANRGFSVPGLSGSAGKIGATSRSAGSAVTGRAGSAAGAGSAGGRGSAAGAGGRGGAGAGGGAGKAGKAGGRGAGGRGGAGGAGGRGSKKDRAKGGVWDGVEDGDQWIDDDAAGDRVID